MFTLYFWFLNTLFHRLRFWLEVLLQYNMFWTWICSPSICHSLFLISLFKVKKKRNISKIIIWLFADNIWKAPYKSSIYNVHVLHVYNTQQIYILVINTLLCVWNNFISFSSIPWYLITKSDSQGNLFTTNNVSNFFYIYMFSQPMLHIDNFKNAGIMSIICIQCLFHI